MTHCSDFERMCNLFNCNEKELKDKFPHLNYESFRCSRAIVTPSTRAVIPVKEPTSPRRSSPRVSPVKLTVIPEEFLEAPKIDDSKNITPSLKKAEIPGAPRKLPQKEPQKVTRFPSKEPRPLPHLDFSKEGLTPEKEDYHYESYSSEEHSQERWSESSIIGSRKLRRETMSGLSYEDYCANTQKVPTYIVQQLAIWEKLSPKNRLEVIKFADVLLEEQRRGTNEKKSAAKKAEWKRQREQIDGGEETKKEKLPPAKKARTRKPRVKKTDTNENKENVPPQKLPQKYAAKSPSRIKMHNAVVTANEMAEGASFGSQPSPDSDEDMFPPPYFVPDEAYLKKHPPGSASIYSDESL